MCDNVNILIYIILRYVKEFDSKLSLSLWIGEGEKVFISIRFLIEK